MTPKKIELESKNTPTHAHLLKIPIPLWNRMLTEAGLKKGDVTQWLLKAAEEKLERDKSTT